MNLEICVFPDLEALSRAALNRVMHWAQEAVDARGRFTVALSGGKTPRRLYELWNERDDFPWRATYFFLGDERFVLPTHPESNQGILFTLWKKRLLRGDTHLVAPETRDVSLDTAARLYEEVLWNFFGGFPRFDLILLGLGEDCHTASLFPGHPALRETQRLVVPVENAPKPPAWRLTFTLPVLNHGRHLLYLIAGAAKAEPVYRSFELRDPACPASHLKPRKGTLSLFLDRAAAQRLSSPGPCATETPVDTVR